MEQFEKLKEVEASLQQKITEKKAEAHDLMTEISDYTELVTRKRDELSRVNSQLTLLHGKIEGVRSLFYL